MIVYGLNSSGLVRVCIYSAVVDLSECLHITMSALLTILIYIGTAPFVPAPISDVLDPQFEQRPSASRAKARRLCEKLFVWR